MKVKNSQNKEETWTIDLKKEGKVYRGPARPKADVTIILSGSPPIWLLLDMFNR